MIMVLGAAAGFSGVARAQARDTTLDRLIAEARAGNRGVQQAQARLQSLRAARLGAALDLAPTLTAAGGYTRQRLSNVFAPSSGAPGVLPDQELWDAGLVLAWDVDLFGRSRRALQGQSAF